MTQLIYSFPAQQVEFFGYERTACQVIFGNGAGWGVSAAQLATLTLRRDTYEEACIVTDNNGLQNPIATKARNDAAISLKEILGEIYEQNIIYNTDVDDRTKGILHIHLLEGNTGTICPAPKTTPDVTLKSKEISILHLIYSDSATPSSHAKPDGVAFCEFVYTIDLPIPEAPKDCLDRYYISRSNTALVFEPEQRGKKIYGFARWVNKNSKFGPWSGMVSAIIP